jgi:hypothetical protein
LRANGGAQARRGIEPELVAEQALTELDLADRSVAIARGHQAAHEQLVVALVEMVAGHSLGRVRHGGGGPALGEQGDRGLPHPRLDPGREPVSLHHQPRLEFRAAGDREPLEQLAAEVEQASVVVRAGQQVDVELDVVAQRRVDRVAREHVAVGEGAAQLGQAPTQGAQRVVGSGEQQLCQLAARDGPGAEHEVGKQRPCLAAPRGSDRRLAPRKSGRPEQPYRQRHASTSPHQSGRRCHPTLRRGRVSARVICGS